MARLDSLEGSSISKTRVLVLLRCRPAPHLMLLKNIATASSSHALIYIVAYRYGSASAHSVFEVRQSALRSALSGI
jgi:hypothetical protein